MKFILTIIFSLCSICVASSVQDREQIDPCSQASGICDPRKTDQYGKIPFEDEKARLDNIAVELQLRPDNVVYLYVYDGLRGCAGEAQARAARAKDYLVKKRGIRPDRVIWQYGGHREDLTVDVWVWPRSVTAPGVEPTADPREARLRDCKSRKRRVRGKSQAAHNNRMHPTARKRGSHVEPSGQVECCSRAAADAGR